LSICLRKAKNTVRSLKGPFLITVSIYRARIIPCMSQRTSSSAMTDLKRICVWYFYKLRTLQKGTRDA